MNPTIKPGDSLLAYRVFESPARHEIFGIRQRAIKHHAVKQQGLTYLKRIVGLPGDELTFRLQDGQLMEINSVLINYQVTDNFESYLLTSKNALTAGAKVIVIPYQLKVENINYSIFSAHADSFVGENRQKKITDLFFNYHWLKEQLGPSKRVNSLVTIRVPSDHYFLLSDNRVVGIDSRHFGPVHNSALKYRAKIKGS